MCTITEAAAPHTFAYRTRGAVTRDATAWTLRLEPAGDLVRLGNVARSGAAGRAPPGGTRDQSRR
ncbi:hypothetical protein F8M49_05130 [Rhodococcus zopfii]|uniref:Uncharacterized protein n=1 Tax=Rhodococcus zopfii TaxID=43772 RepID=A0ABU3WLY1_9NOCA|nr:hypothetical protein [Rhodococcus zopfii]